MKHLPKSTLTEILNDPYGFTYKEMSEVIGEDKARALYAELYKQPFHKKNLSISTKKVYKSSMCPRRCSVRLLFPDSKNRLWQFIWIVQKTPDKLYYHLSNSR